MPFTSGAVSGSVKDATRGLHQSASSCSPSANVMMQLVLESPSSSAIAAAIASLYELLGGDGNGTSPLGACPAPSPGGKGWISSKTDMEVVSTMLAPYVTTTPVGACNSDWAQEVWKAAASALGNQVGAREDGGLYCNARRSVFTVWHTVPHQGMTSRTGCPQSSI